MSNFAVSGLVATIPRHLVTQDGLPITSFRMVQKTIVVGHDGAEREEHNWFTITSFRNLAINTAGSIGKGDRVNVIGQLRVRDWDNGERAGTSVEIDAETIGHDLAYGTSVFTRTNVTPPASNTHGCNCDNCDK